MDLAKIVEQAVTGLGYELVDVERSPGARLLRIYIDIERGVNVDDCAVVSNHLQHVFEVENVDYDRLEISSPGLDRPLKKLADFERYAGQEVQLRVRVPVGNQRNFAGVLEGVRGDAVVVRTEKGEFVFPLEQVEKARLVPKF